MAESWTDYVNNDKLKEITKRYCGLEFVEFEDGSTAEDLDINLVNEMPRDPRAAHPDILTYLPERYAFYCRIRDLKGAELKRVRRARKNARDMYYHRAANPDPQNPTTHTGLQKVTEKAIEAWTETRADIMEMNADYDRLEDEYTILCSACEAIKMYFDAIKEMRRSNRFEENYASYPQTKKLNPEIVAAMGAKESSAEATLKRAQSQLSAMKKQVRVRETINDMDLEQEK